MMMVGADGLQVVVVVVVVMEASRPQSKEHAKSSQTPNVYCSSETFVWTNIYSICRLFKCDSH
jgi:hypothetical protein